MKKYKVTLLAGARQDIREAKKWYNRRQKGLGKRLTSDMTNTLQSISANPKAFAIRYKDFRLANFDIFPYAAHFYIDESSQAAYITAILHTSMHPDIGRNR